MPKRRGMVVLLAAIAAVSAAPGWGAVPPTGPYCAGAPIDFSADADSSVVSATVYYRAVGARSYLARPATVVSGRVAVDLPASAAVPPGTEYYLEIRTADGRVLTDPPSYPKYNPHRLEVVTAPPPRLALAREGPVVGDGRLVFHGPAPGGTRYYLDGVEVTDAVVATGEAVAYTPSAPLAPGTHRFAAVDEAGRRVEVPVDVAGAPAGGPRGVLGVDGSLSFNYGYSARSRSGSGDDRVSGNLHVEAHAEKGEFSARFSGVNVQYDRDTPDPFTISSGYLFEAAYGEQRLELGDLSVDETSLTATGFSRRGAQVHLKAGNTGFRAFDVRTDTVEGWDTGFSSSGSRTFGAAVETAFLPGGGLDLHLVALRGENDNPSGANDESNAGPQEGDTFGVQLGSTWGPARLEGQYAFSRFDPDTASGDGKQGDSAYELRLTSDVGIGTLNLGYLRYGTEYATIADPSFTGDRQGGDAGFSTQVGPLSWSLGGAFAEDNVARDASRPIVRSLSGETSAGWRAASGASLNAAYSVARQDSRDEPAGTDGVDNLNQQVSASLAHAYGVWNGALSGSLGFLDDRTVADNDTDTRNATLATGVGGSVGSASLSLSFNQSVTDARTDRSRLASLTLAVPVWPEWVDLSGQGSYQLSDASDGTVDTATTGGSVRLSWNVSRLVEDTWVDWVNVQLAVAGEVNRVDDRIDDANDSKEYLTFLTFNFGAPYRFGAEVEW